MLIDRPWYELSTQPQLVRLSKGQKYIATIPKLQHLRITTENYSFHKIHLKLLRSAFTFSNIIINKASKSTIHQNTGNKNKYKSNKL